MATSNSCEVSNEEIVGTGRCCVAALWLPLTAVRFETKTFGELVGDV